MKKRIALAFALLTAFCVAALTLLACLQNEMTMRTGRKIFPRIGLRVIPA